MLELLRSMGGRFAPSPLYARIPKDSQISMVEVVVVSSSGLLKLWETWTCSW